MPITTITPQLGLNLDNDFSNVKNGEFVNATDVKIKSDGTSNGYILQNIEGNEFKFTIPDVVAQNKKWLLQQGTDGTAYTLTLYDAYNNVLATATDTVYATLLTAFDSALAAVATPIYPTGISFVRITGSFGGKQEDSYEFTGIPYYNYNLVATGNPLDYIYLVQEAIDDSESSADYTAMKRVVGNRAGNGGVWLFLSNKGQQTSGANGGNVLLANTSDNGVGILRLETSDWPHGLTVGQYFNLRITGCVSNPDYNGVHIAETVVVLGVQYLDILDVEFGTQEGLAYEFYISNYGELGFVDYANILYNKRWSTTQWDFTILNPIDCRVEPNALGYDNVYWSSLQEYMRVFYAGKDTNTVAYKYNFTTFGLNLVPFYHVLRYGFYDYETVAEETLLQLPNISEIEWISQSASGGAILAGNWRYFNSFLASDGSQETELSDVTNIVEVFLNSISNDYAYVLGNESDVVTSKVNNLQITGYPQGVYKYVVLYGAHYAGGAVNVYRIKQQLINDETVINISHYGTETYELMSLNELRFANLLYKAQNIEINDNRLIPSNLILEGSPDLTEFTDTITYNIQKEILVESGEYKNPTNANHQVGCMVNEGYVYGVQYVLKDGTITDQVYPIKEVIIINGDNTPAGKRVAGGITDVSITDSVTGYPYVFYPNFIIDWDGFAGGTLINGKPAREVIKTVKFWRAEVINPRVIACGFVVPTVFVDNVAATPRFRYSGDGGVQDATQIYAFPGFCGDTFTATDIVFPSVNQYVSEWNGGATQVFAFYAPDYFYTGNQFSYQVGDEFILANTNTSTAGQYVNTPVQAFDAALKQFSGEPNATVSLDVSAVSFCTTGGTTAIGAKTFSNFLYGETAIFLTDTADFQYNCFECHVIQVDTGVDVAPTYAGYGYYIRPRADQYGDYSLLKFSYTNILQNEADVPLLTTVPVAMNNGGDTFTQLTPFKQRVKLNDDTTIEWGNGATTFYTQNRINSQMRVQVGTQNLYLINSNEVWLCNVEQEAFNYNAGYSIYGNNYIKTLTAFDPNIATITDYGSRMIWSDEKPAGSLVDDYRIIPPLNFYDFPIANGSITDLKAVNRQLIVLQPLKVSHKYFNSEGAFTTVSGDNIVLGENAVASRRETDFTSFGSRHKQSVVVGRTESGKDSVYWVCSDYKKIMRYGADGTVCISDRAKIKSWCEANILDEFNVITNSISGRGISAGWNQKDKEYIVTLRYGSNISADPQFTLLKTISFCEVTNRFVSFYNAFPTCYIQFVDVYLTPDSTNYNWFPNDTNVISSNTGDIYLHDDDAINNAFKPTYYGNTGIYSDVSLIVNADVLNNKLFQNFEVDYEGGTPAYLGAFGDISFDTKTQTVANYSGDFELALDLLRGQVPLDGDGENLNGIWLKTKLYFDYESIAKLIRYTVKFQPSRRLANV